MKKIILTQSTIDSLQYTKALLKSAYDDGKITKEVLRQQTFLANKTLYVDTNPSFAYFNTGYGANYSSIYCPFCGEELTADEWVHNENKVDCCMYCDTEVVKTEMEGIEWQTIKIDQEIL